MPKKAVLSFTAGDINYIFALIAKSKPGERLVEKKSKKNICTK
jgi:hypothetical protein